MDMEKPHKVGKKIHQLLNLIHTEGSSDNDYVWNAYFKEAQRCYSFLLE